MRGRRVENRDISVRVDKFEVVLEPDNPIGGGDSGGPVLVAMEDRDQCLEQVAGIIVEQAKTDGKFSIIVTKMSYIVKRFKVKLLLKQTV